MDKLTFISDTDDRIDKVLSSKIDDLTRSAISNYIEDGLCLVNGKEVSKNYKVKLGDEIIFTIPDPEPIEAIPQNIPLDIVYEDDDLLIVNKPKNMVVHPAAGNPEGTLVNALLYHCKGSLSGINGKIRPGIVHRIDKDTSGLLIIAKNDTSHNFLAEQIKEHSFRREYEAIVYGNFKEKQGTVNAPIGRHPTDRKKMTVTTKNSKEAVTHYEVLEEFDGFSYVRLKLETGRTHQIRVHMAYINHPVIGDEVYGPKKVIKDTMGQCLHARVIGFIHPTTKEYIEFKSDLPEYFTDYLNKLRRISK
jgi:23S rRNA pseudouridine1911/1915/1917 synthase